MKNDATPVLLFDATLRLLTLRRVNVRNLVDQPQHFVLLWVFCFGATWLVKEPSEYWYLTMGPPFAELGAAFVAALIAASILGKSGDTLRFGTVFLLVGTAFQIVRILAARYVDYADTARLWIDVMLALWGILAVCRFLVSLSEWISPARKIWASLLASVVLSIGYGWHEIETALVVQFSDTDESVPRPTFNDEALWTSQPAKLHALLERLDPVDSPTPRVFIVSVAAGGAQSIFGREARQASLALEQRYGASGRSMTLSNSAFDLEKLPLANRTNLSEVLTTIGKRFKPKNDLLVMYLTSHGSKNAQLSTDLPDYSSLNPISADFLAQSLRKAGIERRLIVVSACYSGSWVKPLASPTTIVLTASAADRTSFGCDDEREYTVFGEAFVNSFSNRGQSLSEAFAATKRTIDAEEAQFSGVHSRPQAFVGESMRDVWRR